MVNKKIFQFSCDYMGGFKVEIDLDDCDDLQDVVNYACIYLQSFLDSNNLFILKEKTNSINYHIHNYSFEELLTLEYNNNEKLHGFICGHE